MSTSFNQPRPKRAFACNEKDLYSIVSIIWNSYSKEVTKFAQYKTTYSNETAITQLANLNAVRLLPDKAARNEFHKSLRIQLKSDAIVAINAWSDISSYIRDAFPPASFKDKCNAAGHGYFNQAIAFDWDAISRLLDRGQAFISDNTSALTLAGMPPSFPIQYAYARATFAAQYLIFMQAEENAKVQTDLRVSLNNALYLAVTALCSDAKKIFRYNAVMREQFTFHRVLILINGGASHASTLPIQAEKITAHKAIAPSPLQPLSPTIAQEPLEHDNVTSEPQPIYQLTYPNLSFKQKPASSPAAYRHSTAAWPIFDEPFART
jgi:hypothetical protein